MVLRFPLVHGPSPPFMGECSKIQDRVKRLLRRAAGGAIHPTKLKRRGFPRNYLNAPQPKAPRITTSFPLLAATLKILRIRFARRENSSLLLICTLVGPSRSSLKLGAAQVIIFTLHQSAFLSLSGFSVRYPYACYTRRRTEQFQHDCRIHLFTPAPVMPHLQKTPPL